VDVPLETLLEEIGEGGVVSHLVDRMAPVRLAPATRKPTVMTSKPPMTLGTPSLSPVLTEKQKATDKLSALAPRTSGTALRATQLSHAGWLHYRSSKLGFFKFLNACSQSGISAQFRSMNFCQPNTFMGDTEADIMLMT
jgi:hypothetical protein